jgi:hypothetical protein
MFPLLRASNLCDQVDWPTTQSGPGETFWQLNALISRQPKRVVDLTKVPQTPLPNKRIPHPQLALVWHYRASASSKTPQKLHVAIAPAKNGGSDIPSQLRPYPNQSKLER